VTPLPTDLPAVTWPQASSQCNECNEALETARAAVARARRLALVAENALLNGDLKRACSVLRDLHDATPSDEVGSAANPRTGR
jgi:hypothetical protein